jgi:hypothetical protein
MTGVRHQSGRIGNEAIAGLDRNERGVQRDADTEGEAEIRGCVAVTGMGVTRMAVAMAAMIVISVIRMLMIFVSMVVVMRMIVIVRVVMAVSVCHGRTL